MTTRVQKEGVESCIELSFQQRTGFPDLVYELETSQDLLSWSADQGRFVEFSREPSRPGFEKVTFHYRIPPGEEATFFRLRVTFAVMP